MKRLILPTLLLTPTLMMIAACGGGESKDEFVTAAANDASATDATQAPDMTAQSWRRRRDGTPGPAPAPTPAPAPAPAPDTLTDSARVAAATSTAQSSTNDCAPVRPFYWEIGDRNGRLAAGSVNSDTSPTTVKSATPMSIASASKWVYGAYVVQKRGGDANLGAADIKFLNFRSGYTNFDTMSGCPQSGTIGNCVAYQNNGLYSASTDGKFDYGGGHMENHAALEMGLSPMNNASLATELQSQIGNFGFMYTQPQLAGGLLTSADGYAAFLRKILSGELAINAALGSHAVCTNPRTCSAAVYAPIPTNESWHYSVGHWVEDDPVVGDGAFSSPGAFGFYPWINVGRTTYGVLARSVSGGAFDSVKCGRLIRKAWTLASSL